MTLKLACADFTFPLLPHEAVLDLIQRLGVEGVDIGLFHKRETHLQPADIAQDVPRHANDLRNKLDDCGLKPADIYLILSSDFKAMAANHPDASERRQSREMFQKILEFTARCNGRHMSGVPGVTWEQESYDSSLSRSADELSWRVEQAAGVGVTYSIEPHLGSIITTPAQTLQLLKKAPTLTLTLDYGHFTQQGIADAQVEPLVKHASHFHARCACEGRLQCSMKQNTIDYERVLRAMKQSGYAGYLGLEYVWIDWQHCNDVDNVSETILLRDLLRKAVA